MHLKVSQKIFVDIAFLLFTLLLTVAMKQEVLFPDFLIFIIKSLIYNKLVSFFVGKLSRSYLFQKHKFFMGGSTLHNCYILHIRFILLGKIGSGLETNSTFQVMFLSFSKWTPKIALSLPVLRKIHNFHSLSTLNI